MLRVPWDRKFAHLVNKCAAVWSPNQRFSIRYSVIIIHPRYIDSIYYSILWRFFKGLWSIVAAFLLRHDGVPEGDHYQRGKIVRDPFLLKEYVSKSLFVGWPTCLRDIRIYVEMSSEIRVITATSPPKSPFRTCQVTRHLIPLRGCLLILGKIVFKHWLRGFIKLILSSLFTIPQVNHACFCAVVILADLAFGKTPWPSICHKLLLLDVSD